MDRKLRVLLLVMEPWRKDDSGGNTLDNFFHGMKDVEFAQIYCGDAMPENDVCQKYFHIPEAEMFHSFFIRNKVGQAFCMNEVCKDVVIPHNNKPKHSSLLKSIKRIRPESLISLKLLTCRYSNWKTPELRQFIIDFNPDVIYAPCYASPFQLALTRYVKQLTGKGIVTWSADDCYSLRQFNLSPFFWINRFWNRHCLRKTYPCYDEFFSISEDEIEEMSTVVGKHMKLLRKGVVVPETFTPREVHHPIKFIYAGGLYLNRHKSLIAIADALRDLNKNGVRAELHIYTGTSLSDKVSRQLNDGRSVYNHGLISSSELSSIYQDCDVAIHCESFDLKYRLGTRLSFSTKVIDCFQSGCAILAIAWEEHTALKYLQKEDAAFCVTSVNEIAPTVRRIVENPELIPQYARKAYECEYKNHRIEDVQKTLYDSLVRCSQ